MILRAAILASVALLADATAFALAVQHVGIRGESNPAIVAAWLSGGMDFVLALKVIEVLAVLLTLAVLAWRLPPERRWWAAAVGYAVGIVGLLGAATGVLGAVG